MARPKKIVEETKVENKIEETIESETNSHKMVVVYDTVENKPVLIAESSLSPRYKHY